MVVGLRDRSLELYQLFDQAKARHSSADGSTPQCSRRPSPAPAAKLVDTARFYSSAGKFSKELSGTSGMIADLADLVKQQTVFDDQAPEIAKLTAIVKDRLAKLNTDLSSLVEAKNAAVAAQGRGAQQAERHSETVVNTLRSKLGHVGLEWRGVLSTHSMVLKENCLRNSCYGTSKKTTFESALFQAAPTTHLDSSSTENSSSSVAASLGQEQLQQLAPVGNGCSDVSFFNQRHEAIRDLGTAVVQIGEMSHDFNRMVYEQEERVLRIDTRVDEAEVYFGGGLTQLEIHLRNIRRQRGMILKIFGVLFFFLLFFGLVVVR